MFSGNTQAEIQKDMLAQMPDNIDKRQGSIAQTAIGPTAWALEGLLMEWMQMLQNMSPETAVGEWLENFAITRGITRKQATPAVLQGTFNMEIPEGSEFQTLNGANSLIFVSGSLISEASGSYVYQMTCQTPGEDGNAYTGPIIPITSIPGLTSATIGTIITAGTNEETDDSLRSRYFATFDVAAFGGNIAAYRSAILAIDGVGAVQVYPAWQGGGTVLCSILNDELQPALPATVQNVQNIICPGVKGAPSPLGFGMAPIGAAVTIVSGSELTLNIACDVQFVATIQNGVEVYQSEIEQKIQEYLNMVNQAWGNALKTTEVSYPVTVYISRIIYAILTIPDVVNVSNVTINGSTEDLTLTETAQLQQVAVLGTVTINGD